MSCYKAKGLKGWEGKEHCTVNSGVRRQNSLDADNNYGNDDDDEVQNCFHNASSLEFGVAQLQSSGFNEIFFLKRYVTSLQGSRNEVTFQICALLAPRRNPQTTRSHVCPGAVRH
jgi:hypothetical protein